MLVQEEGRAARNQIAFHVDLAAPMSGKFNTSILCFISFHLHRPTIALFNNNISKNLFSRNSVINRLTLFIFSIAVRKSQLGQRIVVSPSSFLIPTSKPS